MATGKPIRRHTSVTIRAMRSVLPDHPPGIGIGEELHEELEGEALRAGDAAGEQEDQR
jgi:hypothetical protein